MASPIPVAVVGRGRLGAFASRLLESDASFRLVASYGREDGWAARIQASEAGVALDATVAGLGEEHALRMLALGVRPVVATSGVDPAAGERLDARARELGLGGLVVPNFSLGALWLRRAAELLAAQFPAVEIVEGHHAGKRDAPSSTALDVARCIASARGPGPGATSPVPIHSVRLPGLHACHEVIFGGEGEVLTLRHDVHGPEAFGPGLLLALLHAASAVGVGYGLDCALETRARS